MGKNSPPKRAARRLKMRITNCGLRNFNFRRLIKCCAFIGLFCALAKISFAQSFASAQSEADWTATKTFWERQISLGSNEQKRGALFQIRNYQTAQASRIAVPALRDKSEIVRATAAFSVIFLSKDEALNNLLPLLKDKKKIVRREAAYALGKIANPQAINPLIQTFQKDKISDVKNASIVALGEIGDASAIDALIAILQRRPKKENPPDEFLRRSAARSIGQIAQIIETDKIEVLTPESFLPEKFARIEKPKYPKLIENFPVFRGAINVLIETLQNPLEAGDTKREAAFALGSIGDETAKTILQTNLNAADYYLAQISQESLRKIEFYAAIYRQQKDAKKFSE